MKRASFLRTTRLRMFITLTQLAHNNARISSQLLHTETYSDIKIPFRAYAL